MKKKGIITAVIISIILVLGIGYYLIIPGEEIQYNTLGQPKTLVQSLININSASISNKSLEVTLDQDNINDIVSSLYDGQVKFVINDNKAYVYTPIKLFGFINTDIKIQLGVTSKENKIDVIVQDCWVGKLRVSSDTVMKHVEDGEYKDVYLEKHGNNIYIYSKYIKFTDAELNNDKVSVKCYLSLKDIIGDILK